MVDPARLGSGNRGGRDIGHAGGVKPSVIDIAGHLRRAGLDRRVLSGFWATTLAAGRRNAQGGGAGGNVSGAWLYVGANGNRGRELWCSRHEPVRHADSSGGGNGGGIWRDYRGALSHWVSVSSVDRLCARL